jgi:hypothetical protein
MYSEPVLELPGVQTPGSKPKKKCIHGRARKAICWECGGGSTCKHKKLKSRCKECGGRDLCEHNRIKVQCKECRGKDVCKHLKRRYTCKECKLISSAAHAEYKPTFDVEAHKATIYEGYVPKSRAELDREAEEHKAMRYKEANKFINTDDMDPYDPQFDDGFASPHR